MRDYKLSLNLITNNSVDSKRFKQYDTGNEIELEVFQNENLREDEKLVLTDETVLAFFKRKDGQVLQKNCSIRDGNIIVRTEKDVLGVPGPLELECLIKKDSIETTTQRLTFQVDESINRSGAIEEDPRYYADLITDLLNTKEKFDNMKINIRNLVLNSKEKTITASSSQWNCIPLCNNLEKDTEYTVSVLGSEILSGTFAQYTVLLQNATDGTDIGKINFNIGNSYQSFTFKTPNIDNKNYRVLVYAGIAGSTANNSLKLKEVKVEKGNKCTGWIPSSDEIQSIIDIMTNGGKIGTIELKNKSTNEDEITTLKKMLDFSCRAVDGNIVGMLLEATGSGTGVLRPYTGNSGKIDMGSTGSTFRDIFLDNIGSVKTDLNRKGNYEWGWWTPVLYTSQGSNYALTADTTGSHYYRLGNIIRCFFKIKVANWNSDWGSYLLLVRGLPYAIDKTKIETGGVNYYSGAKSGGNITSMGAYLNGSATLGFWLCRYTQTVANNIALNMLEQSFEIQGWYEYSI